MKIVHSLIGLLMALLVAGVVIAVSGYSPWQAYEAIFIGAFGSGAGLTETLTKATPLIFTGLAVATASRCGLFNIGAEGQLLVGGLAAALAGFALPGLPPGIHLIVALAAAMLAGAAWAAIAGFLKVKQGTHEVIITIMLNYIAASLTGYAVNYPFKAPGPVAQTPLVAETARLARIGGSQLSLAFPLALLAATLLFVFLFRTHSGFELRAVGLGQKAARTAGIPLGPTLILAMALSGALAGLAGAGAVLGTHHRFIQGFSPGYGYDGIAVAVLGRNHPCGVVLAALLFGALRAGGMVLDRTTAIPIDFVLVVQALVIVFVVTPQLIPRLRRKEGTSHA